MKISTLVLAGLAAAVSIAPVAATAKPHGWHTKKVCKMVKQGHHAKRVCKTVRVRY